MGVIRETWQQPWVRTMRHRHQNLPQPKRLGDNVVEDKSMATLQASLSQNVACSTSITMEGLVEPVAPEKTRHCTVGFRA